MADFIERNDALDCLNNTAFASYEDYSMTFDAIEDIPAENCWIPCSEMFPEDDEPVLITCNSYQVHKAWYDDIMHRFNISDSDYWYREDAVLAWMPLPEAYRPSKSEEQEDDNIL